VNGLSLATLWSSTELPSKVASSSIQTWVTSPLSSVPEVWPPNVSVALVAPARLTVRCTRPGLLPPDRVRRSSLLVTRTVPPPAPPPPRSVSAQAADQFTEPLLPA